MRITILLLLLGIAPLQSPGPTSFVLARVKGRAIAPVCPTLAQIRDLDETRKGRWHDANMGCGQVLSGNFERAELVADSGKYVLLRFSRRNVPSTASWMYQGKTSRELWTPRARYVVAGRAR
ncbi:MAG: hypothetical protein H0W68_07275 [Gemmatimonadaceae bacterium]|nr:hypothetical protein [Gemmatimonadaceae bacterium]